jgi:hypothetical protein
MKLIEMVDQKKREKIFMAERKTIPDKVTHNKLLNEQIISSSLLSVPS